MNPVAPVMATVICKKQESEKAIHANATTQERKSTKRFVREVVRGIHKEMSTSGNHDTTRCEESKVPEASTSENGVNVQFVCRSSRNTHS